MSRIIKIKLLKKDIILKSWLIIQDRDKIHLFYASMARYVERGF